MDFDEFEDLIDAELASRSEKIEEIFSVSGFIGISNQIFHQSFDNVVVEGEVFGFKINQGKFVFFDLKDENSTLNCFSTVWQMRTPIEDGMIVAVKAEPKLTDRGKFSLTVKQIIPKGEGDIKKSFSILKNKLEKEGLFSPEKKRFLPNYPKKIGVISSIQAAGYADFVKIANERWGGMKIEVAHVQVQGFSAPDQIIRALDYFNSQENLPEVIVIIRGGGSADDLAAFNDEKLARLIASSRTPILTGIGHETDESLADLAADFAASTPSSAAQVLIPDKNQEFNLVKNKINNIYQKINKEIETLNDQHETNIKQIWNQLNTKIAQQKNTLIEKMRIIESYNPEGVLRRGYAIISGKEKIGKTIEIRTSKKIILAEIKNVKKR